MWSKRFWQDTAERVLSTAAQAAIGALGVTAAVQDVDWRIVAGTAGLAAVMALGKCLAASRKSDTISPASLVK